MRRFTFLLIFNFSFHFAESTSALSGYVTIKKSTVSHGNVISFYPKGWITKAARSVSSQLDSNLLYESNERGTLQKAFLGAVTRKSTGSRIREFIYLPSSIILYPWVAYPNVSTYSVEEAVIDDDHLCSLLCDQGFIVHTLNISPSLCHEKQVYFKAIRELISNICISKTPRNIALITQELSAPRILSFLSEV